MMAKRLAILALIVALQFPVSVQAAASNVEHIPILAYHHIDDQTGPWHVPTISFEQQLAYLSENSYHTVTMDAYTNAYLSDAALPDKPVVLTFDDGYEDAYTTVFPLLKRYGFTATFYIITGAVGKTGFVTWDQIREMYQAGMNFGGHTITHPYLTHMSQVSAFLEMLQSRLDLESHLGVPIITFAFPYNDHNQALLGVAALAGYKSACIVDLHAGDEEPNIYAIPRITVSAGESIGVFQFVLARGYRGLAKTLQP